MAIPIKNIYFLLSYAWKRLDVSSGVQVHADDAMDLPDLFARLLINCAKVIIKKGVDRSYVLHSEDMPGIKGKFEVAETLKRNLLDKHRAVCSFDEFSANILTNQILLTTLSRLQKTVELDYEYKREIKHIRSMFWDIDLINLKASHFKSVKLNRNNRFYGFIIDICRMVFENMLPSETPGVWNFMDFTRDERQMNRLYEEFIFNYFTYEHTGWAVTRDYMRWNFSAENPDDLKYLPRMITDITLSSPTNKIIIDAKYYGKTVGIHYDAEKIHSHNLYQIFSYLINQENGRPREQAASGMLLYPTIEKEFDLKYRFREHDIYIKTLNLNASIPGIKARLDSIIEEL